MVGGQVLRAGGLIACALGLVASPRAFAAAPPEPPAAIAEALVFSNENLASLEAAAPMLRGDELVQALPVAGGGLAIGHHQLYEYLGGQWQAHPWNRGGVRTTTVNWAVMIGEQLYVVGDNGLCLRRRDARNFDAVVLDGVSPRTRNLDWLRAWASADGERLYVRAGYDRLLQIDLATGHTRLFPIPLDGSGGSAPTASVPLMTGRSHDDHDELLLVMGRGVYRFDGREVVPVASFDKPVEELAFAGPERATVKVGDGVVDLPLSFEGRGEGVGDPELAALSPQERRTLAASERREAMRKRQEASAAAETFWFPTVRVSPGVQFGLGEPEHPLLEEMQRTRFVLDTAVGVLLAPPTGDAYERGHAFRPVEAWFWPELGYTWTPGNLRHAHAVTAGLGFGAGNDFIAGYYKPRLELGFLQRDYAEIDLEGQPRDGKRLGWGARHGLSAQALWGTLGVEVSHGMAFGEELQHDLRVSLDINLAPLVWMGILWATL